MTTKQIEKELNKIYKERKSWNGARGPFTKSAIRRRTLILFKQKTLYNIENAKREKDKNKEAFNLEICKIIDKYSDEDKI